MRGVASVNRVPDRDETEEAAAPLVPAIPGLGNELIVADRRQLPRLA